MSETEKYDGDELQVIVTDCMGAQAVVYVAPILFGIVDGADVGYDYAAIQDELETPEEIRERYRGANQATEQALDEYILTLCDIAGVACDL